MTRWQKGLLLGAIHVLMVASLGAKLLVDRATSPRVWVKTAPVDPDLPIRGRYVRLRVEVDAPPDLINRPVSLRVEQDRLVAVADERGASIVRSGGSTGFVIAEPVAFFIPEHAPDPSRREPGEELWVEVTVPRRGPPRPIRLGVRKDGTLTPVTIS